MIGYPENFIEPPLGYYVREQLSLQVAKADPHRFTLYRTDFLPGTDRFSPGGADRFNRCIPGSPHRRGRWSSSGHQMSPGWRKLAPGRAGDHANGRTADRPRARGHRTLSLSGSHGCRGR